MRSGRCLIVFLNMGDVCHSLYTVPTHLIFHVLSGPHFQKFNSGWLGDSFLIIVQIHNSSSFSEVKLDLTKKFNEMIEARDHGSG